MNFILVYLIHFAFGCFMLINSYAIFITFTLGPKWIFQVAIDNCLLTIEPILNVLPHSIPNTITKKQSFSVVKDKDGKSGGINLKENLQCTHCVGWKATTALDRDHDGFLEEKQLTNFQCVEEKYLGRPS